VLRGQQPGPATRAGEASRDAAIGRLQGSAAVVAVLVLAAKVATDPARAARQERWGEFGRWGRKADAAGGLLENLEALLRRERGEFLGEAAKVAGRARHVGILASGQGRPRPGSTHLEDALCSGRDSLGASPLA